jgi:hypothetical protein
LAETLLPSTATTSTPTRPAFAHSPSTLMALDEPRQRGVIGLGLRDRRRAPRTPARSSATTGPLARTRRISRSIIAGAGIVLKRSDASIAVDCPRVR